MAQLREIRSESLSGLICRNSDHPETGTAPRHGFDLPDRLTNPTVKCLDDIDHLDLGLWKEEVDSSCRVSFDLSTNFNISAEQKRNICRLTT